MNCEQFQETLPYIIEHGGNEEEEGHLRSCPGCAELVRDLKYIAEQAKLILPMYDPSPRVWSGIEHALHQQGLLQEGRMSRQGHSITTYLPSQTKSWTPLGWAMALATLAVFTAALVNYRPHLPAAPVTAQNSTSQAAQFNGDDQRLIRQVSQQAPDVGRAYETSLREANAYIEDAQQAVDRDPNDDAAQEQLQQAYQQKETLYQMAVARSLP
jgi:hypothetical protein